MGMVGEYGRESLIHWVGAWLGNPLAPIIEVGGFSDCVKPNTHVHVTKLVQLWLPSCCSLLSSNIRDSQPSVKPRIHSTGRKLKGEKLWQ